ncbi:hypothetical protein HELRODRAFT_192402 [Helobdella robusta]|uniref:DZF domain-containing protein n=1 Tax=Helobdella robusta TaxID=6412 RepID=T1FTW9_HELRO|nr:hypothetical protein HELRODRAFT_192402 [Helobdella robusta]ESO00751.1 hypothetical protein HELRODRAFT_192402 [Helobdella robusta]
MANNNFSGYTSSNNYYSSTTDPQYALYGGYYATVPTMASNSQSQGQGSPQMSIPQSASSTAYAFSSGSYPVPNYASSSSQYYGGYGQDMSGYSAYASAAQPHSNQDFIYNYQNIEQQAAAFMQQYTAAAAAASSTSSAVRSVTETSDDQPPVFGIEPQQLEQFSHQIQQQFSNMYQQHPAQQQQQQQSKQQQQHTTHQQSSSHQSPAQQHGQQLTAEQQKEFQRTFQQAFEKNLQQQIKQQILQQLGQTGNLGGASVVDGVAVFFGDDSVGKKSSSGSVHGGSGQKGGVGSAGGVEASGKDKSKYYCSVCDVVYANSLAFTSHLGSEMHKLKKEKALKNPPKDKRPEEQQWSSSSSGKIYVSPEPVVKQQQQQQPQSLYAPDGRKLLWCKLCEVSCAGADLYAQHIKGDAHQKVLQMTNEQRRQHIHQKKLLKPEEFGMSLDSVHSPAAVSQAVPIDEDNLGSEYIEELRKEDGELMRIFCNLCKVDLSNLDTKMIHMKSSKHVTLYWEKKQREGVPPPSHQQQQQQLHSLQHLNFSASHTTKDYPDVLVQNIGSALQQQIQQQFQHQIQQQLQQQFAQSYGYAPCDSFPGSAYYNNHHSHYSQYNKEFAESQRFERSRKFPPNRKWAPGSSGVSTKPDFIVLGGSDSGYNKYDSLFKAVQKVLTDVDKWLKPIVEPVEPSQQPITSKRIGAIAKGLLIRNHLVLDILLIMPNWPTKSDLRGILNKLENAMQAEPSTASTTPYSTSLSPTEESIVVKCRSAPFVVCNIHVTCVKDNCGCGDGDDEMQGDDDRAPKTGKEQSNDRDDVGGGSSGVEVVDVDQEADRIDKELCAKLLKDLDHTKWFQTKANMLPSCVLVVRVLKSITNTIGDLSDELIELGVYRVLKTTQKPCTPGKAFIGFIKSLASGSLLPDDHPMKVEIKCKSSGAQLVKDGSDGGGSDNKLDTEKIDAIRTGEDGDSRMKVSDGENVENLEEATEDGKCGERNVDVDMHQQNEHETKNNGDAATVTAGAAASATAADEDIRKIDVIIHEKVFTHVEDNENDRMSNSDKSESDKSREKNMTSQQSVEKVFDDDDNKRWQDALCGMGLEERVEITSRAQKLLKTVLSGDLHEVLGLCKKNETKVTSPAKKSDADELVDNDVTMVKDGDDDDEHDDDGVSKEKKRKFISEK